MKNNDSFRRSRAPIIVRTALVQDAFMALLADTMQAYGIFQNNGRPEFDETVGKCRPGQQDRFILRKADIF